MSLKRKEHVLVVAIDFGTAYSGYAFQFQHEFDKDPIKISAPQAWNGGKPNLMSNKTPTCLLLDKDRKIHSFGFEAENKYADLCIEQANQEWYFFRRFKMKLQEGEGLKKDSQLEDETGKKMPALQVFSLSIQCLMNHLTKMLDKQGTGVGSGDIHWVLTVPAIWNDSAKQFMRTAAEQLPASLQDLCKAKKKCTFKECVEKSAYSNQIKLVSDKMRLDPELVRDLFRQVTDKIVDHVEELLKKTPGVSIILMVGGFSESGFVQDVIRSKFQKKMKLKVVVPREAGLSVLNGAVIFGWKPEIIEARVLRYTYGVKITPEFIPGEHPESKRVIVNGKPHCTDVFSAFIEVDTQVETGHRMLEVYNTINPKQECLAIQVYVSPSRNPKFVTDPGCQRLGQLNVTIPDPTEKQRNVIVVLYLGIQSYTP